MELEVDGPELGLVSMYLRPGLRSAPPTEEWDTLFDHLLSSNVAGDFIAKIPPGISGLPILTANPFTVITPERNARHNPRRSKPLPLLRSATGRS